MLNLKKGLALVLAAATAFTFAPVANLGAIDAKAGQVLDTSLTSIDIQKGAERDFKVKDLSQLANFDNTVTVINASVDNENIAKIVEVPNSDAPSTVSGSVAKTAAIGATEFKSGKALIRIQAGTEIGQTKLHLESRNTSGTLVAQEDILINVTDLVPNVTFDKSEVNFEKIADSGQKFHTVGESNTVQTATVVATLVNGTLPTGVTTGDWKAESSDTKVVTVSTASGNYSGSGALSANTLTPQGVGEATVTWTFTYKVGSVTHSVCAGTVKVKVTDSTDTLSVKYDPDRTGKADAENVSISTKPDAVADDMTGYVTAAQAVGITQPYYTTNGASKVDAVYKTGKGIVIDSVQNLTAKINISDSMGRAYTVRSNNNWIVVDNAGNITIANKATGDRGNSASMVGNITVNVPATTVNSKLVAAYTITIPVTVYNKEATSLQVNESVSNKLLGKTVGGTSGSDSFDEIPKLYLSTKDKKTSAIEFTTNSGDQYISVAVKDATSGQISDAVSYDAASKTLTALKAGKKAIVTVTCRNNADTYGEATVKFGVEVVSKNANNIITTASETYNLTKSARTASIGAKSTYATTLKYELVKGIDSTETATSSDVTVDGNGNLSYTSNNKGTAYVRISGNDTADALAPADKYVTVQYGADKAASPLSVTTTQVTVDVDETAPIVATAGGIAVSYKSSDESVATVDANGVVTGKKAGSAFITVSAAETDDFKAGQTLVPVIVNGDKTVAPEKVTGLKVSNKKGAYVSVKWTSQGKNINYRVYKKVGNGKWVGKNVAGNKTTLSVKKGAKVQVKVKSYVKNSAGKTTWGPSATKAKTFKTDKK